MTRRPYGKLARTHWEIGQLLMPVHFRADEQALAEEAAVRVGLGGPPAYGVADLTWDEAALAKGSLAVGSLLVVTPGGELLAMPGNATVSDLDLKAAGTPNVTVYLHVRRETRQARGLSLYAEDPAELGRVVYELVLSLSEHLADARLGMKLAVFACSATGEWALDGSYVPPVVRVGSNPLLAPLLDEQRRFLRGASLELARQLGDTFFGGEGRTLVRRCQIEVAQIEALIDDIDHGIHLHPYTLFQALRRLYIEVCFLAGARPDAAMSRYNHDDLAGAFARLSRSTAHYLRYRPEQSPHMEFVRQGEMWVAGSLGDPVLRASEVYLILQKPTPQEHVPLDEVKLASPRRLAAMHAHALVGVGFEHVPIPTFRHGFGPEVDFYRLSAGEAWEDVRRERAIAFYHRRELGKARAALFWREG